MANTISMFPFDRFKVWYFPAQDFQVISMEMSFQLKKKLKISLGDILRGTPYITIHAWRMNSVINTCRNCKSHAFRVQSPRSRSPWSASALPASTPLSCPRRSQAPGR